MATKGKKGSSKKSAIKVDFEGVEDGGMPSEGSHVMEIVEAEVRESSEGNDYINLKLKCTDEDDQPGKIMYHACSLQPQALFNLRAVLTAIGHEVPDGVYEFEADDMVGGVCQVEVSHEKYEGKTRARGVSFDEVVEKKPAGKPAGKAKKDEEEEKPKAGKKKTKKEEPEFEVGQKVTFTDDDGDEQTGKIKEIDGDSATVKVGKDEWEIELSELTAA